METERDLIALFPYDEKGNAYVQNMVSILSKKYRVIAYNDRNMSSGKIKKCKAIILNWYENRLNICKYVRLAIYKYSGIKIIWVFHNKIPHESKNRFIAWGKMKSVLSLSDTILLHSRNSKPYLKWYGKSAVRKSVYVPHINYCANFKYTEINYREELKITDDDFVYMFFGFMSSHKNIELLIRIFNGWTENNVKLLIVGVPEDRQYVEKLKKLCHSKNVIILDRYVPNSKVYAYFNTCDVTVMPYHKESYLNSGVMINAFSCGRTVIVPDIPMAKDMHKLCHVYHYNHESEHKNALMKAMKKCHVLGRTKNHEMGERAKQYIIENHSEEKVLQSLENLI